jgi:hypothetical protein
MNVGMRKIAVLAFALLVLAVPAAIAAGTLDKSTVVASTDVAVTLKVSVEQLGAYDDHVVLEVPNGFRVLACAKTTDFACTQSTADKPSRTLLTWKRTTPGAPVPLAEDQFPFRMHTIDKAGSYVFAVHQFYSDSTRADWAPKLTVTAAAAKPATTTTTTKKAQAVHTASAAPTRPAVPATGTTEPLWLRDSEDASAPPMELGHESKVRQSAPMVVAGLLATVAAGGVFWLRRRAAALP